MVHSKLTYALLFTFVILVSGCVQQQPGSGTGPSAQGQVLFTIADKTADLGMVSKVEVTIDNAQIHSPNTDAWATISSEEQTFDLLALKAGGLETVFAQANLSAGTYNQVKLHVKSIKVTYSDGSSADATIILPSGELKIVGNVEVNDSETTIAKFDFDASKSLHTTGEGKIIFAPVLKFVSTSEAKVVLDNDDNVAHEENGRETEREEVGTDVNGDVGVGHSINANVNLTLKTGGKLEIGA